MPMMDVSEVREMPEEAFLARDTPDRPHALIAVGNISHAETAWFAHTLASHLEVVGFIVEIACAKAHAMPVPPDYDLVVIGMSPHAHDRDLLGWIEGFNTTLSDVASALFLLGRGADRSHVLDRLAASGWRPHAVTAFPPAANADAERSIAAFAEDLVTLVAARASAAS